MDASAGAEPEVGYLIDNLNASFGGAHRTAHAIGIGLRGTFVPALDAATFSIAAMFVQSSTLVTARFSNGPGGWVDDDRPPDVRGLAVKFHLADEADMIAVSMDSFFVKTPEQFVEFLQLIVPTPQTGLPNERALAAWLATHPNAAVAFAELQNVGVDTSYGGLTYNSLHAFRFVGEKSTTARFRWIPDQPSPRLPRKADTSGWPSDYLRREIVARVRAGNGPGFTLVALLQGPGDPDDDSSVIWRSTTTRTLGHMQLSAMVSDQYWGCEALRFNPCRVIAGIELTPDPVLLSRQDAYEVSADRRCAAYPPP